MTTDELLSAIRELPLPSREYTDMLAKREAEHRIIDQCNDAGVKVFFKQMGAKPFDRNDAGFDGNDGEWPAGTETENWRRDPAKRPQGELVRIRLKNKKGNAPAEWPGDLRVRELPEVVNG